MFDSIVGGGWPLIAVERQRGLKRLIVLCGMAACCLFLICVPTRAASGRWAILAAPEVEESGLSDLLTIELSKSVELVERESLQRVMREVELSQIAAADGVGLRLRVGPQFKAERLVVLTVEKSVQQSPYLRLVICETGQGTRLLVHRAIWPTNDLASMARELAEVVSNVDKRFPNGVQRILGVGPFLSKNLLHHYDYLQHSYSTLLVESLLEYPGLAVLELDEYRALGQELSLNGANLKGRLVPLLIEGEFEVAEQGVFVPPLKARVSVTIKTAGAEQLSFPSKRQPLTESAAWLRQEVPPLLLQSASSQNGQIGVDEQFAALISRADDFATIGLRSEAIALRESALLMKDDFIQQLRLIGDYRLHVSDTTDQNRVARNEWLRARKRTVEEVRRHSVELDDRLIPLLERYGQLVTQRIAAGDVNMLEGGILWSNAFNRMTNVNSTEGFATVHDLRTDLFWNNIRQLKSLDTTIRDGDVLPEVLFTHGLSRRSLQLSSGGQSLRWSMTAMVRVDDIESHNTFLRRPFSSKKMFDDIERFLQEAAPWPVAHFIRHVFPKNSLRSTSGDYDLLCTRRPVTMDEFTEFYRRLAKSNDPLMKFYGRVGLLGRKLHPELDQPQKLLDQSVLDEFSAVRADLHEYCEQNPQTWDAGVYADGLLTQAEGIVRLGRNPWRRQYNARQTKLAASIRDNAQTVPVLQRAGSSKIRFVPVPEFVAKWDAMVPCGPSLDAVFTDFELSLMDQPGQLRSILKTDVRLRDYIQKVHWDGRWIWVTTRRSGLRVFEPSGRLVGHLPMTKSARDDAANLPLGTAALPPAHSESSRPSSYRYMFACSPASDFPAFRICPVGDGRCIAVGQFGARQRSWICSLRLNESGEWSVKLVHQGVKIATADLEPMMTDASYAFRPSWIAPFESSAPGQNRAVVIGRAWYGLASSLLTPLVVDLETEQVSFLTVPFQLHWSGFSHIPTIEHKLVYRPSNVQESLTQRSLNKSNANPDWLWMAPSTQLVPTSRAWYRLHSDPVRIENLAFDDSAGQMPYVLFATSSHFGPVAWRPDGQLSRVVIEEVAE